MNPNLFLSPFFLHSVGAAAGYDTCQFTKHYMLYIVMFEVNMLNETT